MIRTRGGWTAEFGEKLSRVKRLAIRTHTDDAGNALAAKVIATAPEGVEVYRLEPDPADPKRDDNARHKKGELDDDPMAGCSKVEPEPPWELLKMGKNGVFARRCNAVTMLEHFLRFKRRLHFSDFDFQTHLDGKPMADGELGDLAIELSRVADVDFSEKVVFEAVRHVARRHRCHEVADYLRGLEWDGVQRLARLFPDYFGTKDDALHRVMGIKWAIGAVARPLKPGVKNDNVLVLIGPQGTGKSSAVAVLAVRTAWSNDTPTDLTSKDARIALLGTWLMEYAELESLKRSKASTYKAFLTDQEDRFRMPYARTDETFARTAVFVCTANEKMILKDPTGNRRFWPVEVGQVDLDALKRDRDQLWAEAVARHDKDQGWKVAPGDALWDALERHRIGFLAPDFWEEVVEAWLNEHAPDEITISEVLMGALDIEPRHAMRKGAETRLGPILTRLGWEKGPRRKGPRGRCQTWVPSK